jgi:hypothetical protein
VSNYHNLYLLIFKNLNYFTEQRLFPGLEHAPLNISRECMAHFYPYNAAPESELGSEPLTIDEMTAPFMVFIYMSLLAMVGLVVEILFKKTRKQPNTNTHDIDESVGKYYQVRITLHFADGTTAQKGFNEELETLARVYNFDYNIHSVYQNNVRTSDEALE